MEKLHSEIDRKYNELNEQNKIMHCQLDAMHMKLAGKDGYAVGAASAGTSADTQTDAGLQSVVGYLWRSKEIAETEISLLKQEKLRLQSQIERAQKASNFQAEQDVQQQLTDISEREEEEMLPEGADLEGGDDATFMENQDASKVQPDYLITDSTLSPVPYDDDTAAINMEVTETNSPEISNSIEQTEEGEVAEDVVEDSDKSTDGNDQRGGDAEQINEANLGSTEGNMSYVESAITREDSPSVMVSQQVTQS